MARWGRDDLRKGKNRTPLRSGEETFKGCRVSAADAQRLNNLKQELINLRVRTILIILDTLGESTNCHRMSHTRGSEISSKSHVLFIMAPNIEFETFFIVVGST